LGRSATKKEKYKVRYSESNTTSECIILFIMCRFEVTTCFGLLY